MARDRTNVRHYTCLLLEKINDGSLDPSMVVQSFCSYLSEDDVYTMMRNEEILMPGEDQGR